MYRLAEIDDATAGERLMADLKEGRAHMIRPKYQLPNDASPTPQNIGPDVAAERKSSKGIACEILTLPLKYLSDGGRTIDGRCE